MPVTPACSPPPAAGIPAAWNPPLSASANGLSIDKSNFVDNRSGPLETVSSLLNALNLKQYVRAYSYFQVPGTFPGSYDPWAAGYANTDTITATFGTVQSEGAAGSLYYKVPLGMVVLTTSSATQTFVGCYTLHLAQPANQAVPPFQPLGIVSGKFSQAADAAAAASRFLPPATSAGLEFQVRTAPRAGALFIFFAKNVSPLRVFLCSGLGGLY